jgi:hypothetical protein
VPLIIGWRFESELNQRSPRRQPAVLMKGVEAQIGNDFRFLLMIALGVAAIRSQPLHLDGERLQRSTRAAGAAAILRGRETPGDLS